jgi:predicted nucleic acid-binding protein
MNVYIDSSVILRLLLMEANPFEEWGKWKVAFSSELAKVEVWRNIHRLHVSKAISGEEFKNLSLAAEWLLAQIDFIRFDSRALRRAAGPFPTIIGTLDAIHLSTALLWRENNGKEVAFLSHDRQLRTAARDQGFEILPISRS